MLFIQATFVFSSLQSAELTDWWWESFLIDWREHQHISENKIALRVSVRN